MTTVGTKISGPVAARGGAVSASETRRHSPDDESTANGNAPEPGNTTVML